MPTYYFKPKNSNDKFSSRVTCKTMQQAVEYFAEVVKKLPVNEFEKIYEVKREDIQK